MGQQTAEEFHRSVVKRVSCRYLLYVPPEYEQSRPAWPLLLFLHGAGERGTDLERVKVHGLPNLIASGRDYPFVVVSPQWPDEDTFWDTDVLIALLDEIEERCRIDPDRIYVTGLSMGGHATWALAAAEPERFAAIAPICGRGRPKTAKRIAHIPAWVFHGARDEVVPLAASQEMVDALKASGGSVRFTVYPEAGHDSWSETYENPQLYEWLLRQRRGRRRESIPRRSSSGGFAAGDMAGR